MHVSFIVRDGKKVINYFEFDNRKEMNFESSLFLYLSFYVFDVRFFPSLIR